MRDDLTRGMFRTPIACVGRLTARGRAPAHQGAEGVLGLFEASIGRLDLDDLGAALGPAEMNRHLRHLIADDLDAPVANLVVHDDSVVAGVAPSARFDEPAGRDSLATTKDLTVGIHVLNGEIPRRILRVACDAQQPGRGQVLDAGLERPRGFGLWQEAARGEYERCQGGGRDSQETSTIPRQPCLGASTELAVTTMVAPACCCASRATSL